MAGPITIKLTQPLTNEDLLRRIKNGWDEKKYGTPQTKEVNHKRYLGFPGTQWITTLVYAEKKKVVVQSMPVNFQVAFTKEGKAQLKYVNREVLPLIAQGMREILADILK